MHSDELSRTSGGPPPGDPGDPTSDVTVVSSGPPAVPSEPATTAAIGTALAGTMLGPYRLENFVGGGGMGAVFRAHDTTLDRVVAVKVLSRAQSADEDMLRRFRNEAQSAARLDHENIGRVHAVGSDRGWHYIVFEFIEGRNLRDLVRDEGPFAVGRAIDVTVQVAEALEHAAERDVVHRDIKPSNIVITPAGRARIVDMGLARLPPTAGDADLTASGMTLGTFDYISPEQARDPRAADVRSDLYSLGCTLFFMLAGRPPFADGTMVQKLLQHQQDPPPAIRGLRPDVPERLAAILGRLMAKDPSDRYQRPAVLAADLVACAEENGIPLAAPRPAAVQPVEERPVAAVWPWLVPVCGLLATVAGLWLKAAADRRAAPDLPPPAAAAAAVPPPVRAAPRVIRVGGGPPGSGAVATLAEAVAAAADGDIVELDHSGARDTQPLRIAGRRIVVRAAAGRSPAIRFVSPPSAGGPVVGCDVADGGLRLVGLAVLMTPAPGTDCSMFRVAAGSLACEGCSLEFRPDPAAEDSAADAERAFVTIAVRAEGGGDVSMLRSRARGDAEFLAVAGAAAGEVSLSWTAGEFVSPRRFLAVAGGGQGPHGPVVDCRLQAAVFACRDGFAVLRDSPSRPRAGRLRVVADDCRFLIAGGPLVEQSGLGEPEAYRPAVAWTDRGSLYEGSDVFRRIDGAAGSVTEGFAEQQDLLRHAPHVEAWPEAATWVDSDG